MSRYSIICSINVRVTDHLLHLVFGMVCSYGWFIFKTTRAMEAVIDHLVCICSSVG